MSPAAEDLFGDFLDLGGDAPNHVKSRNDHRVKQAGIVANTLSPA